MLEKKDVQKLAELSRIEVTDSEAEALTVDMESILEYISDLQEVSSEEIAENIGVLKNVMREDGEPHARLLYTEALLENAPKREGNYLSVKKILTQD